MNLNNLLLGEPSLAFGEKRELNSIAMFLIEHKFIKLGGMKLQRRAVAETERVVII